MSWTCTPRRCSTGGLVHVGLVHARGPGQISGAPSSCAWIQTQESATIVTLAGDSLSAYPPGAGTATSRSRHLLRPPAGEESLVLSLPLNVLTSSRVVDPSIGQIGPGPMEVPLRGTSIPKSQRCGDSRRVKA